MIPPALFLLLYLFLAPSVCTIKFSEECFRSKYYPVACLPFIDPWWRSLILSGGSLSSRRSMKATYCSAISRRMVWLDWMSHDWWMNEWILHTSKESSKTNHPLSPCFLSSGRPADARVDLWCLVVARCLHEWCNWLNEWMITMILSCPAPSCFLPRLVLYKQHSLCSFSPSQHCNYLHLPTLSPRLTVFLPWRLRCLCNGWLKLYYSADRPDWL